MTKEEIIKHLHEALNSVDITFPYRYVFVEAIEALSQPSLPSDIDEAAEENFETMEVLEHENIFEETHHKIFKAGAEWMQNKMFSLRFENEPLDSAARNVFKEWIPMEILTIDGIDGGIPLYNQGALIMMFDAGAEWLAEQGIKLHGRVLPGPKCNLYIESDCFDRGYKGLNYSFNDSNDVDMFIQIRKK